MIVTENNIRDIIGKTPIKTDSANVKGEVHCEKLSAAHADIEEEIKADFADLNAIAVDKDNGPLEIPAFQVMGGEVQMGYDDPALGAHRDVDVNITGTLNYNGETLDNLIAQGAGAAVIHWPRDIDCDNFTRVPTAAGYCDLGEAQSVWVTDEGDNNVSLPLYLENTINEKDTLGQQNQALQFKGSIRVAQQITSNDIINANGGINTNGRTVYCGKIECTTANNATGKIDCKNCRLMMMSRATHSQLWTR